MDSKIPPKVIPARPVDSHKIDWPTNSDRLKNLEKELQWEQDQHSYQEWAYSNIIHARKMTEYKIARLRREIASLEVELELEDFECPYS